MTESCLHLGIDVGSTTAKLVVIDDRGDVVLSTYRRHHADVRATVCEVVRLVADRFGDVPLTVAITGSGGVLFSHWLDLPFVQEVVASKTAVEALAPETSVAIELGGEDAKIIYFDGGVEQRMNGTCAGGTGAFIDQMAVLLDTDAAGLDALAAQHEVIYPIASRCGVFAKADVQPLLNEGARREDIAASVLQAVVNQTISGLACGRPIRGVVAYLGGPLHYLGHLRERFVQTLAPGGAWPLVPKDAHLFVAHGAAMEGCRLGVTTTAAAILAKVSAVGEMGGVEIARLAPLFASEGEYEAFCARHARDRIRRGNLAAYRGEAYLGVDAGSTTIKLVLVGADGEVLLDSYAPSGGDVLVRARAMLSQLYARLPADDAGVPLVHIGHATVTGYGEGLLKEALRIDSGEVETVAHLAGAEALLPGVEFVLDIGGQDMKCLRVRAGAIEHIMLNETCSSGCGSFISTFARSQGMTVEEFAQVALFASAPADLGSRCTVFMNSRVKQAQKECATPGDIAAGLSYSVVKNALLKVIRLRDVSEMGEKIVVQGGTFLNDAVLRAFELFVGKDVVRPDAAGTMGAYGAALIARRHACEVGGRCRSTLLGPAQLDALRVSQRTTRCRRCTNHCLLTMSDFDVVDGDEEGGAPGDVSRDRRRRFVTGNRCERGARAFSRRLRATEAAPNIVAFKTHLLFDRAPLPIERASRGVVGIPRVLNMYENYPFWHTFFTSLGFRVELSGPSDAHTFSRGIESLPSENVCYPAKLAHGHTIELVERGVSPIFLPCLVCERVEDPTAPGHFNCPIVSGYPEALGLNIEALRDGSTEFLHPYLPFDGPDLLAERLYQVLVEERPHAWAGAVPPTRGEVARAVGEALAEDERYHRAVREKGEQVLRWIEQTGSHGIVLAGMPYHADPGINHAIPELVTSFGLAVLTEDSVAHLAHLERPLRVDDQWVYQSRLYTAAKFVTMRDDVDLIQLDSFGCGLDAVSCDMVREILEGAGKPYTSLRIDQISNLGAARIRVRSLIAALRDRAAAAYAVRPRSTMHEFVPFTSEMQREGYTILCGQMAPIHFELFERAIQDGGYNFEVLPAVSERTVELGLKYANNDMCYPAIHIVGQVMEALLSGRYDPRHLAIMMTNPGDGCRASNYLSAISRALRDAGFAEVPVISSSLLSFDDHHPGFRSSMKTFVDMARACIIGDALMLCLHRTRPYEQVSGSANALFRLWMNRCKEALAGYTLTSFTHDVAAIVADFDTLALTGDGSRPRVGVVGEIHTKYDPDGNNDIVTIIEAQGCEAVVGSLMDYLLFEMSGDRAGAQGSGATAVDGTSARVAAAIKTFEGMRAVLIRALECSSRFDAPLDLYALRERGTRVISRHNTCGMGWLLAGEVAELVEHGCTNVLCLQPFSCLPNHIAGKAIIKEMRRRYPGLNMMTIDYDPGASEINQLNRIMLLTSVAHAEYDAGSDMPRQTRQTTREKGCIQDR